MEASDRTTTAILGRVLADQPVMMGELNAAHAAAYAAVDATVLELCRVRTARLLGADFDPPQGLDAQQIDALVDWRSSTEFTPTQRACLAFTDQFVTDVASLDDATAAAVTDHLGDEGLANFASALLVVEQRQRMCLAWERLIPQVARREFTPVEVTEEDTVEVTEEVTEVTG